MKILVVSPIFPHPRSGGSALRIRGLIRELAREHELHLLCLRARGVELEPSPEERNELATLLAGLEIRERPAREGGDRGTQWRMLRKSLPPGALVFCGEEARRAFEQALAKEPELVLFASLFPAVLSTLAAPDCPTVVDEHNVEHILLRDAGRPHGAGLLKRLRWTLHWRLVRRFEARVLRGCSLIFATSAVDADGLRRLAPGTQLKVIPNGFDLPQAQPPGDREIPGRILFTGLMDYPPNVAAAHWFADQVLPLLAGRSPEVAFVISGARPAPAVLALGERPGITVTGAVQEMADEVDQAAVVAVPLKEGSGTRLKVLEAWSRGKAVVSTRVGCEGLACRPGEDVALAEEPAEFAARIAELLDDPELRRQRGSAGFETAREHYSWEVLGRQAREAIAARFSLRSAEEHAE